ncbi:MAG: hypothetical protein U0791_09985 [Gemmataceae bacterium]
MAATSSPPTVLSEIRQHGGRKLSAVGKLFPASRGNGTTNPATVWRWARVGALTPGGMRVKLEVVKVGMSWLTSDAAVDRFVAALTGASMPASIPAPKVARSESARRNASQAAGRKLAAMGA